MTSQSSPATTTARGPKLADTAGTTYDGCDQLDAGAQARYLSHIDAGTKAPGAAG